MFFQIQAAKGDYHQMVKMLRDDQRLAKHKDFVSGFTALHWAAKHGESNHFQPILVNPFIYIDLNRKS